MHPPLNQWNLSLEIIHGHRVLRIRSFLDCKPINNSLLIVPLVDSSLLIIELIDNTLLIMINFPHFQSRNTIPSLSSCCSSHIRKFTPFCFEAEEDPDPPTDDFEGFHEEDSAFEFVDVVEVGGEFHGPGHSKISFWGWGICNEHIDEVKGRGKEWAYIGSKKDKGWGEVRDKRISYGKEGDKETRDGYLRIKSKAMAV